MPIFIDTSPEVYCAQQGVAEDCLLALQYRYAQYYLPGKPVVELMVLLRCRASDGGIKLDGAVGLADQPDEIIAQIDAAAECRDITAIKKIADDLNWPWLDFDQGLPLQPIYIKKPWGQEVWFTGIEERGQSLVGDQDKLTPLPWVLSVAPKRLARDQSHAINLLKILDPLPESVFGDLYFELHEEKQEVYVVTNVDSEAWPTGEGGICFGFDPAVRAQFNTDKAFKDAFAHSVKQYEDVRREIDLLIDNMRERDGIGLNEPVDAVTTKKWLQQVPAELQSKEAHLREEMDRFKGRKPLRLGDVIKVPCFTPHSLMHGVRTIEFQTPVYERKILSFAQKVLTQDHWDTDKALECLSLDFPADEPLALIEQDEGLLIEEVVNFSDFDVWRISLAAHHQWQAPELNHYRLVIGVAGAVTTSGLCLGQEQAAFLPATNTAPLFRAGDTDAVFLLAVPK